MEEQENLGIRSRVRIEIVFALLLILPILLMLVASLLDLPTVGEFAGYAAIPVFILMLFAFAANFFSRGSDASTEKRKRATIDTVLTTLKENQEFEVRCVSQEYGAMRIRYDAGVFFLNDSSIVEEELVACLLQSKDIQVSKQK